MVQIFIAFILVVVLGGVAIVKPRSAIAATLVFLGVLGDFRRGVDVWSGYGGTDPILLVAPLVSFIIVAAAFAGNRLHLGDSLSRWVAALSALMVLEIFNPAQGGPSVGFAGGLFYLVPMFWFWIGKAYGSTALVELVAFRVVVPLAVLAAALEIYQVYFGLLPFEQAWVDAVPGYTALWIGANKVRPIAFFTSSSEMAQYIAVATTMVWAASLRGRTILTLFIPLFVVGIFLASQRGVVVTTVFAATVQWAIQSGNRRSWLPRLSFALLFGFVVMSLALTQIQKSIVGGEAEELILHQTNGLLNPYDERESTVGLHASMLADGLADGFLHPFGRGLGATTIAAEKFGDQTISTEVDLSNMMVSLGVFGGGLYLGIILMTIWKAVALWTMTRSLCALVIVGALLNLGGNWLNGGEYSIVALVWLFIGILDRLAQEVRNAPAATRARYA